MTFLRRALFVSASLSLLTACGGDTPATPTTPENTIQNPAVTPASSPVTPSAPAVEKSPSAEFSSLPAPYTDADYARGRRTFKLCQSCHTLAPEGQNLVGPPLYGIFGRQIGASEGFAYSTSVSEADFIWTPEKLDEWLTSPRNFLPGNKMAFSGVRKPQDRLAVIAYIMLESGYADSDE